MQELVWIGAVLCAVCAGCSDSWSRRIPNWLTVPAAVVGLGLNAIGSGWSGVWKALAGAGLALGLLLPLVCLRGLGAGDWKLMGALGAFLGPKQILWVLFGAIFVAGLMAIIQVFWRRRVETTLSNLGELIRGAFVFRLRPHPVITLDNPAAPSLPFGVAVAVTVLIFFWIQGPGI